jgi:hypothetical protein
MTRLTRRPLPLNDPNIEKLTDEERREVASLWIGRSAGEWESTRSFQWLENACIQIGTSDDILKLVRRAHDDEERHGEICRKVASAYYGKDLTPTLSERKQLSLRTPEDPELEVALYFAEASCLGEVIGAVTIESSLLAAKAPLARAALQELLTDEISHARMGFAYLAAPHLGASQKEALAEWLPILMQSSLERWSELGALPTPHALTEHGCLSFEKLSEMILIALSEIALPGFSHLGVDIRGATEFLEAATRSKRPASV